MKKYSIQLLLAMLIVASACKKEAKLTALPGVNDPFIRTDNPNSIVDHTIYQIYENTQVPILYTDTVQKKPLTIIDINYHLTGTNTLMAVRYLKNQADLLTGINFVKNNIIPALGGPLKPYSVLIVDSLIQDTAGFTAATGYNYTTLNAYQDLNTLIIANITKIKSMDTAAFTAYKTDIYTTILSVSLNNNPNTLASFYAVSTAYYNNFINTQGGYSTPLPPPEQFGIVSVGGEDLYGGYYIQGEDYDLSTFLNKYLTLSQQDFAQQYAAYPLMLEKYQILQQILTTLGFKKI